MKIFEISAKRRNAIASAALLFLAVLSWSGLAERGAGHAGYDSLQAGAHDYLLDIRKRALEVFLAARTADGLIALMESVQVGPVVAEAKPGMVLEPIREVMTHLGDWMTISVITVEALDIVRVAGTKLAFSVLIPIGLLILAVGPWLRLGGFSLLPLGRAVLVAGLICAIGIPLAVRGEKWLSQELIQSSYTAAYQDVSHIRGDLDAHLQGNDTALQQSAEPPSLLERMENWFKDSAATVRAVSQQGGVEAITGWLNSRVESALTLMALFLVEVFVLPSLLGYALYRGLQSMIAAMFSMR